MVGSGLFYFFNFFFIFKGWETLFLVLGEEFHRIPGHVHRRFVFGLRNVSIRRQALAKGARTIPA